MDTNVGALRADLVEQFGTVFGGLSLQTTAQPTLTVGVVDLDPALIRLVCSSFIAPELVRFVRFPYSLAALQQEVLDLKARTRVTGVDYLLSIDEQTGRIGAFLPERLPAAERIAETALATSRHASVITVEFGAYEDVARDDACTRYACRPDMFGGLAIGACTAGFTVKRGNYWGITTAGHCNNDPRYHDGRNIGPVDAQSTSGPSDSQFHRTPSYWRDQVWVYRESSILTVTKVRQPTTEYVGMPICMSGAATGYVTCGQVRGLNYTPGDYNNLRGANYGRTPGDSGAAVYQGGTAVGLHKGTHFDPILYEHVSLYSAIVYAGNQLGFQIGVKA